ncbi:hypothetical protein W02_10790 [Nitrospira sp. KM1]|uniref:hypothetical protein n=1 Tax=Nitrospira sp. KM1 TaxID=1936990 RepID=UPI0013A73DB1|nr:hypothetical protein [Nitrospira sp. KM1]BCA53939.1 hypothetical protein W02_10790 [Nitrospira sp. KM1]
MSRYVTIGMMLGVLSLAVNLGCVSTKDRERRALTAEFNKGLGQYKDHRIIEAGPPDNCMVKQTGRGEVCEWKTTDHSVRYYYDAGGVARQWTYKDSQVGTLEGAQDPSESSDHTGESESVKQSIKDVIDDMRFTPGFSGH